MKTFNRELFNKQYDLFFEGLISDFETRYKEYNKDYIDRLFTDRSNVMKNELSFIQKETPGQTAIFLGAEELTKTKNLKWPAAIEKYVEIKPESASPNAALLATILALYRFIKKLQKKDFDFVKRESDSVSSSPTKNDIKELEIVPKGSRYTNVKSLTPEILNQGLAALFKHKDEFEIIMNLLIEESLCAPKTYFWSNNEAGKRQKIVRLIFDLYLKKYLNVETCPHPAVVIYVAERTFNVSLKLKTVQLGFKGYNKNEFSFITPSSRQH